MANQLTKICGIGLFGVLVSACGGSPTQEPQVPLSTPAPPASPATSEATPPERSCSPERARGRGGSISCKRVEPRGILPCD